MKYPIGIQNFEKIRNEGYVYVDKTDLIYQLVATGSYYFLSRPRRFGKSLLLSTMEAYFQGRKDLFHGLAIESLEKEWKDYSIIHLDLNVGDYQTLDSLTDKMDLFLSDLEDKYNCHSPLKEAGQRFERVIKACAEATGKQVVILVDEYDKPLLASIGNKALQDQFRIILKSFYGAMKSTDRYIKFAFLTGVTKFSKVSIFSDLNNLVDISMQGRYQTLCGITDEEVDHYFSESVQQLADEHGVSRDEMREQLRRRYDGYHFRQNGKAIYNPFSLLSTFNAGELGSYWFETGTPTYLVQLLQEDRFCLPDLMTQEVSSDVLTGLDTVGDNPIPVIYQSGYLTIKGFDPEFGIYQLGFPNEEVAEGFTQYLLPYYTNATRNDSQYFIRQFIQDLQKGNTDGFMRRMQTMMADTDYRIVGDAELYFQNAFWLISRMLGFYTEVERATSDGRMDMTVKTKDYIYIFEFKMDKSAEEALRQIDEKQYAAPFALDARRLFKVGVSFSREHRRIEDWKIESEE